MTITTKKLASPPSFDEATNRRQKVRAAGLDPNYWYAVEQDHAIAKKQIVEVKFWGDSIALYRDESGRLHAVENRCAHRQLPLTVGSVVGDRIVCEYHGWSYNGAGELADVPHTLFGKKMPQCKLRTFPIRVRYGLVWMFFGDAENADSVPMPEIPELEGDRKWECVPVDVTWKAHHSMIIDNVSDFTHEYLHRKYAPFNDAKLTRLETVGDSVELSYDTKVGRGKISSLFVDRGEIDCESMELAYQYPYQWSNTDNKIKHWLFVLPIDEKNTRGFFLFYFDHFVVPFTKVKIPRRMMRPFLRISNKLLIRPLLSQDGIAVEAEQQGYEKHWDAPIAEISPAVNEFQKLTVRKWEEYLSRERAKKEERELVRLTRRAALERADAQTMSVADGAEE
ncbi:MAG: Rieske 2Fe-2S domain-containing protein [Myxococcota bacterium]|nr:Rieske 2Fe-2S domain-containing protein [Myxococcota bacterium]